MILLPISAKLGTIYFVYAIPALSLLYILSKYVRTQENLYAIMFYMAVTGGELRFDGQE